MMAGTLPKVWNTSFPNDSRASVGLNYRLSDNELSNHVLVSDAFNYPDGKPLPASLVPVCIFSQVSGDPLKARDWVRITGGLYFISERFRNVLVDFDLGTSQIIEVPLVDRQGVQQPGRWYLFHISETKSCLVPEKSTGIKKREIGGAQWVPDPSTEELLAVGAASSDGADLWIDLLMARRIFLSDRLKSALKAAGIRSPGMTLHRCRVVS